MTGWGDPALSRADLLVVAEKHASAAAEEAAALVGARATRVDWADAAAAIDGAEGQPVVAVEAEGAAPAMVADHLPAIAAAAEARGLAVVASFAVGDIDLVAASLFDPSVQLLCAPDPLERVAALLAAARAGATDPHAPLRESDRERLHRLHGEIARIA